MIRPTLLLAFCLSLPAFAEEPQHGAAASDKDSAVPAHQKHPLDPNAPKPKGKTVELKVSGEPAKAYVARPGGKPPGALLVLHAYWGPKDWVKSKADELAGQGYLALAVDL